MRAGAATLGMSMLLAAVLAVGEHRAEAKGQAWVITGGELGGEAYAFGTLAFDGPALPAADSHEVPAPEATSEVVYKVFPNSSVGAVAAQLAQQGPRFLYFPDQELLAELDGQNRDRYRWFAVGPTDRELLSSALTEALRLKALGKLQPGPVFAEFYDREMHLGTFTFVGRDRFSIAPPESEPFVMRGLAVALTAAPAGLTRDRPAYDIQIFVRREGGGPEEGWGGQVGGYSPPADGQPGKVWLGPWQIGAENRYWSPTPELDAIVQAAMASASQPPGSAAPLAAAATQESSDLPSSSESAEAWTDDAAVGVTGVIATSAVVCLVAWLLIRRSARPFGP